ncbi:uncharacterized protein TNCV_1619561, partial [Trichonephila clavipes]
LLEVKREGFVNDALIHAKSLCEDLEILLNLQDESGGSIYRATEVSYQLSYQDDLRRTMFASIGRVTAEIRERFQQLQNLVQTYAFLMA